MLLNKNSFLFVFIFLLSGLFCLSCVDIPSDAPAPPVLNAEFRFISINPSTVISPTQIKMADGPDFKNYSTITIGGNATQTAFTVYSAGSKKIIYFIDTLNVDTLDVSFDTDQKATLVFGRNNSPDSLKKGKFSAYKMTLGYKFSPISYRDTTIVRFVNLMLGGKDTIGVRQDSSSNPAIVGSAIVLGKSSSFIKIPSGKKINYFFTLADNSNRVFKDSLQITGAPYKVKTVFIYDKYDTSSAAVNRNANVKLKELDEN